VLNFRLSLSDLLVHFERPRPSTAKTYLLIMTKKRHTFEVFGRQFLRLKHRGFGLPLFRGNKYSRPCLGELITNTSSIGHVTWKAAATSQYSYIFVKSTRSNKAFKTLFLFNLSLCQSRKSSTPGRTALQYSSFQASVQVSNMATSAKSVLITGFEVSVLQFMHLPNMRSCSSGIGKALAFEFHHRGSSDLSPILLTHNCSRAVAY
jgi:hypothetical protein